MSPAHGAFGEPARRNEDVRLLTGRGLYVDDVAPAGLLHAAFVRSPHGRARITGLATDAAKALPGVVAVFTAADVGEFNQPSPLLIPHPALTGGRTARPLAVVEVRYVGEPVVMVVACSRYIAEDAADLVDVAYEPSPAVLDLEAAVSPGTPLVHADLGSNVAAHLVQQVGSWEQAAGEADFVFEERLRIDRGSPQPIETRGVVAQFDPRTRRLSVWDSTQAPVSIRNGLAQLFGLAEHQLDVTAPDVGGGFGAKIMQFYPEEILVPFAAIRLERPVKWIGDRREDLNATNQEREQIHRAKIAVRKDGTILGVWDSFLHDNGAYTPYGVIVPVITATQLPGPYKIPNYYSEFRSVYTNRVPVSPYRGAGRPQGVFVMERLLDRAAGELGIDRAEIRFRNFIQPGEFPYDVGLTFQDGAPTRYDSGNFPAGLRRALEMVDYGSFREQQAGARADGRLLGIGIACYVEGTGIGPFEGAHVRVQPSGKVLVTTAVGTQGQGHQTVFAQVAAEVLGCRTEDVSVVTGQTAAFNWGIGTFASRAAVVAGNAVGLAARAVREQVIAKASALFEAAPDDLVLAEGRVFVRGSPDRGLTLGQIATAANPVRYAYGKETAAAALRFMKPHQGPALPEGEAPGLEATRYYSPPQATFASGAHVAVVEIDPHTGFLDVLRYAVVHDCGRVINPAIVEGQVRGGVAQGLGGAFYEKLIWDEAGQLLSASFMDYLIPTAREVPPIEVDHVETPSPLNPLGVKGVGEAGTIPGAALIAQAVDDALAPYGVFVTEMPLNPDKLWRILVGAGVEGAG